MAWAAVPCHHEQMTALIHSSPHISYIMFNRFKAHPLPHYGRGDMVLRCMPHRVWGCGVCSTMRT